MTLRLPSPPFVSPPRSNRGQSTDTRLRNRFPLVVWLAAVALAWALAPASLAAADQLVIPDEDSPVIDRAAVLDAGQRQQLVDLLHELKQKAHAQVKVLTVPSLGGEDVFSFAQRHYDLWKLGTKGADKGAAIVLAPSDRKIRIHTGYGLEGPLPDSWCGRQSREVAQKYFVRQQYGAGLVDLTQAVARRVAKDAGVELTGLPAAGNLGGDDNTDLVFGIVITILVLMFLWNLYRQNSGRGGQRRWSTSSPGWGWNAFPRVGGGDWSGGGWTGGSGSGGGWSSGGSDFGGGGSSGGGGGGASW